MESQTKPWFVYILECVNGRLYTGIARDVGRRFHEHKNGRGAMFTRLNKPSHILAVKACLDRSEASRLEASVKRLSKPAKYQIGTLWRQEDAAIQGPDLAGFCPHTSR